jgi:hypothetical protein
MPTKVSDVVDRLALQLAVEQTLAEGGESRRQIQDKLKDEPWFDVAEFCAFHRQFQTLDLKPWEVPPCEICPEAGLDDPQGKELLRQMLALGISRYHPDPRAAIEQAKRRASS